jgi:hypothetical protein
MTGTTESGFGSVFKRLGETTRELSRKISLFQGKKGCNLRSGIVKNFPETGEKNLLAAMGNRSLQMAGRFFPE